jgi:hypothetical protein
LGCSEKGCKEGLIWDECAEMASYRFLLDNCVRHVASCFPPKLTRQLEEAGLSAKARDEEIIAEASQRGYIIVTNNRDDFEQKITSYIAQSSKKDTGCTQVHGLVVLVPSEALKQKHALEKAEKHLEYEGRLIGWKEVNELCLKVVIDASGKATITKLPRCPHCNFRDEE